MLEQAHAVGTSFESLIFGLHEDFLALFRLTRAFFGVWEAMALKGAAFVLLSS
jgi:hypothetical protein